MLIDQIINGLAVGNIYALIAIGIALIFGVANLINFAQGSVFMLGAYTGWLLAERLDWPFWALAPAVLLVTGLIGALTERVALRPLANAPMIAPLLSTIAVSIIIDRAAELIFTPEIQPFKALLPIERIPVGNIAITSLDLIVAAISLSVTLVLYLFLRFHRFGWAIRATAQDRVAALQMGINVDLVNSLSFGIGSALGGLAGLLVGQYYANVFPAMGFQFGLKGFAAAMIGGLTSLPGAVVGGLILGVAESLSVAWWGVDYRDLAAFALLILVLVLKPGGLFGREVAGQGSTASTAFFSVGRPLRFPLPVVGLLAAAALAFPFIIASPYPIQVMAIGFIFAILTISLNVISGFAGQISIGHAALYGIGGYATALLMMRLGLSFWLALPLGALLTVAIGVLLAAPALRLSGHYVAIATLGIGQIVYLVILNWIDLTRGPLNLRGIPGVSLFGYELAQPRDYYWLSLLTLALVVALSLGVSRSHIGRALRAIREDETGALAQGVRSSHYKNLAFGLSAFIAALAGGLYATLTSLLSPDIALTINSILILTMVVLGGMGNIAGSVAAGVLLIVLPEVLRDVQVLGRSLADFRMLFYGIILLLLIRFRPQGIFGSA